jgi:hypothetical protein
MRNIITHTRTSNNSKHERLCSGLLIVRREPLYGAHILESENEEELEHWDN